MVFTCGICQIELVQDFLSCSCSSVKYEMFFSYENLCRSILYHTSLCVCLCVSCRFCKAGDVSLDAQLNTQLNALLLDAKAIMM